VVSGDALEFFLFRLAAENLFGGDAVGSDLWQALLLPLGLGQRSIVVLDGLERSNLLLDRWQVRHKLAVTVARLRHVHDLGGLDTSMRQRPPQLRDAITHGQFSRRGSRPTFTIHFVKLVAGSLRNVITLRGHLVPVLVAIF